MKKIILTAMAVFALSFANAQETKFGAKVALNIASVTGDVEDASSLVGFQIGGFAEFKISDKFAIQPELMYSAQGVKESYSEVGYSFKYESKLAYLNIPVMAKFYATPKFSLEFGPQIGFLLSAKADYTETLEGVSLSESEDIKDNLESVDFGLNFGAGYDFTENLTAGLRYNLGLSNVAKTDTGDNSKIHNSVFSLSLGYKF
jgi:long-subunit fatty acid transport protein